MAKRMVILGLLAAGTASGLWGQAGVYLGLKAGFASPGVHMNDLKLGENSSFLYGAQTGIKIFNLGVELNYYRTSHNLASGDLSAFGGGETRLGYHFLGLNGKFFFPLILIHPYLTGGLGYYLADLNDGDKDKSRGFNLGAGVEVRLGSKWALCGEGRYNHVNLVLNDVDLKIRDFTFSAGLHFYF
ncbi:MAG: porin family protein [Candidatus Aminicenantaceae bacterium]